MTASTATVEGALRRDVPRPARRLIERALEGRPVEPRRMLPLAVATASTLDALCAAADVLRARQAGEVVTYVVNRNINFTNVCIKRCHFCAFSRTRSGAGGYFLPVEEVVRRAVEARNLGATEICVQAGLPPSMPGMYYVELCRAVHDAVPEVHIHGFSPEEVLYGATRSRLSIAEYLIALRENGLGSIPGTSAEILDDRIRRAIAPGRLTTRRWVEVITTAHSVGIPSTSTMMYGHVESPADWLEHFAVLLEVQAQTGGITEFVPLSFVPFKTPLRQLGLAHSRLLGPTRDETLRVHALARLVLGGPLRNIQVSWVKEGIDGTRRLLGAGANDVGGTLINENISTAAGSPHGQFLTPIALRRLIREAGRVPAERTTTYALRRVFDSEADDERSPLDNVDSPEQRFGSFASLSASTQFRYDPTSAFPSATAALAQPRE